MELLWVAPLRLGVFALKVFCLVRTEFNAKAQSRQDATGFFLLRNQETRNHREDFMVSGLPYGIVFGRAFAPWRLCVISFLPDGRLQSLAVCMVADRKVWLAARTGAKGQRPTQVRAGAGLARSAGIGAGAVTIDLAQPFRVDLVLVLDCFMS